MKTPDYKTLLYMQALGAPVDELIEDQQYKAIKRNIEALSDYELMYYHCKLLKMPISTYNRACLIMAIFHNAITEYEAMKEAQAETEAEAQAEAEHRAELRAKIYRAIVIYWGLLCLVAVLICFYMWICWR